MPKKTNQKKGTLKIAPSGTLTKPNYFTHRATGHPCPPCTQTGSCRFVRNSFT